MKRKQITAILLSAVMTVSACMPMNGISAFAAETAGEGNTEIAEVAEVEEEAPAEEAPVGEATAEEASAEEAEPESAEPAQEVQEEPSAEPEETAEPQESEKPEAEVTEEIAEETEDAETVSESDAEEADAASDHTAEEEKEQAAPAESEEDQEEAAQESADAQTGAEEIVEEEEPEIAKGKEAEKAGTPAAASFDDAVDLEVGGSADVSVSEENPYMYFRITPDETSYYIMYSEAVNTDTYGTLYGADHSVITSDDDGHDNSQFEIRCVLAAGKTYYLRVRLYNTLNSGSFTVWLEKGDNDVDFYYQGQEYNDVYFVPGKEVTLSAYAYSTAGEISYSWTDDDGNTIAGNTDEYTFEPEVECTIHCTATNGIESFTWTYFIINGNNLQIDTEKSNYRVNYGDPVTLRAIVTAVDMSELKYQWYKCEGDYQWVPISGANQIEYTVEKVESAEVYQCSVVDRFGTEATTSDIHVTVENHFRAYTMEDFDGDEYETDDATVWVLPKQSATLSVRVEADKTEGITYEWSKDGELIAGADSAEYITEAVTASTTYYCVVSDRFGNSDEVRFGVVPNNRFDAYYLDEDGEKYREHNVYVPNGEKATLSVGVDAVDKEGITYQWSDSDGYIEGANGAEYTTESVTESKTYYCHVEDGYGGSVDVTFIVGVDTHFEAYPEGCEGKTYKDVYANGAQSVTLRVVASADEGIDLQYRWYDYSSDEELSETSAEYVVDPVSGYHEYICYVTDSYGNQRQISFYVYEESYDNYLSVHDSESWGSYCHRTVDLNGRTTLMVEVEANDTSAITYEWQKGPIDSDEEGFVTIEGATASSFTIENAEVSTTYKCIVRDQYGSEATVTYKVRIENNLYIYAGEEEDGYSSRIGVTSGESVNLTTSVHANDKTGLTYQWYEGDHDDFDDAQTIDGATSASYDVDSVVSKSYYFCKVTDKYGNTDYCIFTLYVENHLIAYPDGESEYDSYVEYYVVPGESITLKTMVKADDESQLIYTWRNDDSGEQLNSDPGKPSECTIDEVVSATDYICEVSDQYGNDASVCFSVIPDSKLKVSAVGYGDDDSIRLSVAPGQTAKLQVKASVTYGSMHYKWIDDNWETVKEGTIDEKEATLELPVTAAWSYCQCIVRDDYGNSEYIDFYIYVENHLEAYPEGAAGSDSITIYAKPNTKVTLHTVATADDKTGMSYEWWYYGEESIDTTKESITIDAENTSITCEVKDKYGNYVLVDFIIRIENHLEAYPEGAGLDQFGEHVDFVDLTPSANQALNLKVNAKASTGSLKYSWEKKEVYTTAWGENEYDYVDLDGQTGNTLNVTADKSTDYRCTVSDEYGNEKTVHFYMHVGTLSAYPEGAEVVNGVHNDRAVITTSGGSTTLRVVTNAPANAQLTYKWTEGELSGSGWWPLAEGMNDSGKELVVNATESKRYLCVVTDQFGNQALSYFNINVDGIKLSSGNGTPTMTGDNEYELDIPVGYNEKITLKTLVEGNKEGISFKWMGYDDGYFDTLGETSDSLTVTGGQSYYYKCKVSNANGSVATITYNMRVKTSFTVKPVGSSTNSIVISAAEGQSVTMKVAISGQLVDDWKQITWYDSNGNYLRGGHDDFLTVKVLEKTTYTCKVTDRYGNEQIAYFHILTKEVSTADMEVSLNATAFTYDGKEKRPAAVVKYKGSTLVSGKDYTIAYSNNINAGTAKAIITGVSMTGTVTREFKINKATPSISAKIANAAIPVGASTTVSVTGAGGAVTWKSADAAIASVSGTTVKALKVGTVRINVTSAATGNYNAASTFVTVNVLPAATTKLTALNQAKGIKLTWAKVAGANGYIIYRNNVKVKTISSGATVTFTDAKANTNGQKYTYKVVAKAATGTSTLSKTLVTYRIAKPAIKSLTNSASKKMTSKWAKNAKGSGYEIQYSLKKNFAGAKKATATKNSVLTKTFAKLKTGKVYYVRMRTYKKVGKTKYYSAWSATKKIKIAK